MFEVKEFVDEYIDEYEDDEGGFDEFFQVNGLEGFKSYLIDFGFSLSTHLIISITQRKLCSEGKHFWQWPNNLDEAKQPLKCRFCEKEMKSGPSVDRCWTWTDEFLDKIAKQVGELGIIIYGNPWMGEAFKKSVNEFRIQDKKERKENSPYEQMKRKGREKNGRTNDTKC